MRRSSRPMRAYHGNAKLKRRVLAKIAAHRSAGEIGKGGYVHAKRRRNYGAVACLLEDPAGGHLRYENEFGIPAQLAHLEDSIFELLPDEQAQAWPERFMGAIEPGADLVGVWPHFAVWLMSDDTWGVTGASDAPEVNAICRRVAEGYARLLANDPLSAEQAAALTRDAWAAWEQRAGPDGTDERAVWAARAARAAWDGRAAGALQAAWAARDVWDAHVQACAEQLIELIERAPAAR
ncbi:MAG TPA: hypothetical protein VKG38_05895 [Solirubrobacteraceae bacterium]|nr:hypothetical protein [Solirubrobacteraceae bacterium]